MLTANELNFSGGPGALPKSVLTMVQQAIDSVPEVGLSILGISHRSRWFADVLAETEQNIRDLLSLPDSHAVLFLQGGATLQFSMIPMLLLSGSNKTAEYIETGYWSHKARVEAEKEGKVTLLWDGMKEGLDHLPHNADLAFSADAAYLHYVSNETVEGVQFHEVMGRDDVLRVCDMSSDFLSRPIDVNRFDIIYAHAQKNIGPAGVTVVIIRKSLLTRSQDHFPAMLDYRNHLKAQSNYNTPPVFSIYVVLLISRWLKNDIGGLANMAKINAEKAAALYRVIDESNGFYRGFAAVENRSLMNVVFNLATPALEADFLNYAASKGVSGLAGHRSLGGIRASIYNGMTLEAVQYLCQLMAEFSAKTSA
ncbi:MAG: phosphoserine transaminase [Thiotrichales bacterium]|jgi:phosphoserine aminotransferase|nr:phosphoserine transaminase [Thiotrichales bacterium]